MKCYSILLCIVFGACTNPRSANQTAGDEVVYENTVDSIVADKPGQQKTIKKSTVSQEDLIMNEAVVISNDFYNNLKSQNYTGANKYMHPDALSATPISEWTKIYQNAVTKKGKLGFVNMYDHGLKRGLNSVNGVGDYAELIFDAQYKDGNMREKLTFFRKDSTEALKILAYQYNEIVDQVYISEIFR